MAFSAAAGRYRRPPLHFTQLLVIEIGRHIRSADATRTVRRLENVDLTISVWQFPAENRRETSN
jgi:hypothetical protein